VATVTPDTPLIININLKLSVKDQGMCRTDLHTLATSDTEDGVKKGFGLPLLGSEFKVA
jgi:threonine dehydrogenase-like Zn-dependent dehydrogenase